MHKSTVLLVLQVLEFKRERGKSFCSSVRANLPPSPSSHPGFCAVPPSLTLPVVLLSIIQLTPRNSLSAGSSARARQLPKGQGSSEAEEGAKPDPAKLSPSVSHPALGSLLPAQLESWASPHHRTEDALKLEGAFPHRVILTFLVREESDLQY